MDLYQANQLTDQSRREKSWLCEESEMRNRVFQEDRVKSYQERQALKRITEAESARQLRIYELSTQEVESKCTVNQLMVQIQELQDKVNSLSDGREFIDSEKASGSGLSHVPSQTMSIPSRGGMTSRDSCMPPATQNSMGTLGLFSLSTCSR